jgi:hypothetical protein
LSDATTSRQRDRARSHVIAHTGNSSSSPTRVCIGADLWFNRSMRTSILIPILVALGLGAGCVVREPAYTATYVEYDTGYPVYWADGYYWSYYGGGWYWWSHDRWVVSYRPPRSPVVVTSNGGHYAGAPSSAGMYTRDHRSANGSGYHRAPARRAPAVRTAPARSGRGMTVRNHRR